MYGPIRSSRKHAKKKKKQDRFVHLDQHAHASLYDQQAQRSIIVPHSVQHGLIYAATFEHSTTNHQNDFNESKWFDNYCANRNKKQLILASDFPYLPGTHLLKHPRLCCKFDAVGLVDDYYEHVLDWCGQDTIVAIIGEHLYSIRPLQPHAPRELILQLPGDELHAVCSHPDQKSVALGMGPRTICHIDIEIGKVRWILNNKQQTDKRDYVAIQSWQTPSVLFAGCRHKGGLFAVDVRQRPQPVQRLSSSSSSSSSMIHPAIVYAFPTTRPRAKQNLGMTSFDIISLAWHADRNLLAAGDNGDRVQVWDIRQHMKPMCCHDLGAAVKALTWSYWSSGDTILAGSGILDPSIWMIRVRDVDTPAFPVVFASSPSSSKNKKKDDQPQQQQQQQRQRRKLLKSHVKWTPSKQAHDGQIVALEWIPQTKVLVSCHGWSRYPVRLWNGNDLMRCSQRAWDHWREQDRLQLPRKTVDMTTEMKDPPKELALCEPTVSPEEEEAGQRIVDPRQSNWNKHVTAVLATNSDGCTHMAIASVPDAVSIYTLADGCFKSRPTRLSLSLDECDTRWTVR